VSDPTTALTVPDAGWYPDRNEPTVERWWDGQEWTDHTRSLAPAVAAATGQPVSASVFGLGAAQPVPAQPIAPAGAPPAGTVTAVAAASTVSAGWFADPGDASIMRWWDGAQWTQHTAPVAAAPAAAYSPNPSYALTGGSVSGSSASVSYAPNTLATASLVVGLVSILLNPIGAASIAAIVMGIVALRRAPSFAPSAARRGSAIAGIVIGIAAIVIGAILAIVVIQARNATAAPRFAQATVQEDIRVQLESRLHVDVSRVACPAAPLVKAGNTFACTATLAADGTTLRVTGTFTSDAGGYTWTAPTPTTTAPYAGGTPKSIDQLKTLITNDVQKYGAVSRVDCPSDASVAPGSKFNCEAIFVDGRTTTVDVSFNSDGRGYGIGFSPPPTAGG
jgi:hypothetical protein